MSPTRDSLFEIAIEVNSARSLDGIVRVVMDRVRAIRPFDVCCLGLLDARTDELVVHELAGDSYRDPLCSPGTRVPADESNALGWVVSRREVHRLDAPEQRDPRFARTQRGDGPEAASHILAPLVGRESVFGVLGIGTYESGSFSEEDQLAFLAFARLVGVAIDNLRNYEHAQDAGLRDALTGAFNRRHFEATLKQELSRLERYGTGFALMYADVDHFKQFNDRFGHPVGDKVLRRTVELMDLHTRESDVICRLGGDEFAVILPGTDQRGACAVGSNVLRALRKGNVHHNDKVSHPVTATIGFAVAPDHATDADELMACADDALYYAKDQGRDVCVACPRPAASARKA